MKRYLALCPILALAFVASGCGSSDDPDAGSSTTPTATASPTVSAEPTPEDSPRETAAESTPDVDALSDGDLAMIVGHAAGNLDDALAEYGPEAVYAARVKYADPALYAALQEAGVEVPNSAIVETGFGVCEQIAEGLTFDEIYMAGYEEIGGNDNEDPGMVVANWVWTFVLEAPDSLCPEHQQAKADWEATAH